MAGMRSLKNGLFGIVCMISLFTSGQSDTHLQFVPTWQGKPFTSAFPLNGVASISVTEFRFYVHSISLEYDGQVVWSSGDQHYLVDGMEKNGNTIPLDIPKNTAFDVVSFAIGVDSTLQTSGAHSGTLDPIHGMYWTWQSGYIAWKLEAEIKRASNTEMIQWHVGGYRAPYQSERMVRMKIIGDEITFRCGIEFEKLLGDGRFSQPMSVMSPSEAAIQMADRFTACFYWLPQ
jgi:hypothetical protein